jgi:hypothetical protein
MREPGEEMCKKTLLLALLICRLAYAREDASAPHVVPAKAGLVMIGATQDGFALAADGSSLNADGRVSQEQKLFQIGKLGALALTGTVSIQDPIGRRVRGELNIARIAGAWLVAHPDADVQAANHDLNSTITAELNKFLSMRDPGAERGAFKFGVIIAGFSEGKPVLMTTRYFMPALKGKPARTQQTSMALQAGDLWTFGSSAVPAEIYAGKTNALKTFKDEPVVRKFRSAPKPTLAAPDYINLFDTTLRAAESEEGKKMDGKRGIVALPNRFATITLKDGFAWSQSTAH